jgi:hypothetical protein
MFRAIKISSMTSFGEEVKPASLCHNISRHEDRYSVKQIHVGKIYEHFMSNFSCFATRCLCCLLPEISSGLIRNG